MTYFTFIKKLKLLPFGHIRWQYCDFDNICIIVQPYYDLNEVGLPLENIQFDPIMIC